MPVPVLVWALGALALAAAGIGAAVVLDQAVGKSILLIGPREAGKTTLRNFLIDGVITKIYVQTTFTEQASAKVQDQTLKSYKLRVTDVDGGRDQYSEWKKHAEDADCICFVVDASRLDEEIYASGALLRAKQVQRWPARDGQRRLLLLTHIDQLAGAGERDITENLSVVALAMALEPTRTLTANLLNEAEMQHAVWTILKVLND